MPMSILRTRSSRHYRPLLPPLTLVLNHDDKAALSKSWDLTKASQRGQTLEEGLRPGFAPLTRAVKKSDLVSTLRHVYLPLFRLGLEKRPGEQSYWGAGNARSFAPTIFRHCRQQTMEGYVVDVKDSFVNYRRVSASIGGTVTFENGMKGLVVSLETNTIELFCCATRIRHKT